KLNGVFRQILLHESIVNFAGSDNGPHWDGTVGHLLGDIHDIGRDAEILRAGGFTQATKVGDDSVKNQQNIVLVANLSQALQVALRWNNDARRAGYGLNNDRSDVRRIV